MTDMMTKILILLQNNLRPLGLLAILICVVTWGIDLAGLVHECVYCRTQRTAIGVAGVLMLFPDPRVWWLRFGMAGVCFLGAHVAAAQLFLVIKNINAGRNFGELNLILATGALFTLIGIALLVFMPKPVNKDGK